MQVSVCLRCGRMDSDGGRCACGGKTVRAHVDHAVVREWEDDGIYGKQAPYRPCPTCHALGRQCSGCAGRFTYAEGK